MSEQTLIHPTADVSRFATIGPGTIIGRSVVVHPGVRIGKNCRIEDFSVVGYTHLTHARHRVAEEIELADDVLIRTHCVIYRGCRIGHHAMIGHGVVLREETVLGQYSVLGAQVCCEGYTQIGHYSTIHAQTHLTAQMIIGDYVFIGPHVTTANAQKITHRRSSVVDQRVEIGPTIKFGARIGSAAMIMPGVTIGREAMVAAAANVLKNVDDYQLVFGNPARVMGLVPESERLQAGIDFPADHLGPPGSFGQ